MRKLMRANLARLRRSRLFWLCAAAMAALGAIFPLDRQRWMEIGESVASESCMFEFAPLIGVVLAIFCALFTGTEYADGTLRNKLIVGNTRTAAYCANLFACTLAGFAFCVAYLIPDLLLGALLLSGFSVGAGELALSLFVCLMMTAAFSALYCCAAMLISNRSYAATALLLGVVVLMVASLMIQGRLEEPPMLDNYLLIDASGVPQKVEAQPNPRYLSGTKRAAFQFLSDFLPTGQAMQCANLDLAGADYWRMPLYAALIVLGSSFAGVGLFRRKDLK